MQPRSVASPNLGGRVKYYRLFGLFRLLLLVLAPLSRISSGFSDGCPLCCIPMRRREEEEEEEEVHGGGCDVRYVLGLRCQRDAM